MIKNLGVKPMIDKRKVAKIQKAGSVAVILASSLAAVAVIRALGKMKIPCIVIGHDFHHKSIYTTVALEARTKEEVLNLLFNIPEILNMKPVLFTDADAYLEIIYSNWDQLEEGYYIALSKNNFKLVTKEHIGKIEGIDKVVTLPVTLQSISDIEKQHYPVIIKPLSNSSRFSKVKKEPDKAYICKNVEEVKKTDEILQDLNMSYVIQQLIEGGASNNHSALLYRNAKGKIEVGYVAKKLRIFPLKFGVSSAMISEKNSEIINKSKAIMDLIDFQGIGEFEYKYCEKTNDYILIEVNGRFPLQTGMLQRNNPQFIYTVFRDLIENASAKELSDKSVPNIYWIFLLNDLRAIRAEYKASTLSVNLKACLSARIQGAIWSILDPLPAIYYGKYIASIFIAKLWRDDNIQPTIKKVL